MASAPPAAPQFLPEGFPPRELLAVSPICVYKITEKLMIKAF
jgi:hypothetical protein